MMVMMVMMAVTVILIMRTQVGYLAKHSQVISLHWVAPCGIDGRRLSTPETQAS